MKLIFWNYSPKLNSWKSNFRQNFFHKTFKILKILPKTVAPKFTTHRGPINLSNILTIRRKSSQNKFSSPPFPKATSVLISHDSPIKNYHNHKINPNYSSNYNVKSEIQKKIIKSLNYLWLSTENNNKKRGHAKIAIKNRLHFSV